MKRWPPWMRLLPLALSMTTTDANGATPPKRPHLYFSSEDIPELRERLRSAPFAERWQAFEAMARSLLSKPPDSQARRNLGNMGACAFAYVVTGDERYARRAFDEAKAAIERNVWVAPRHLRFNRGADLVTAELSLGIALVYDWCHAALSKEARAYLREALLEEGLSRYAISVAEETRDWWFEHELNNWRGVCHGGMGVAALALYHESDEARRLAEINRTQIPRVFDQIVKKDGGGHEGVGYHHYGIVYAAYALMAGERFFDDGAKQRALEQMRDRLAGYWDVYMQGPDLRYANIGRMGGDWGKGLWTRERRPGGGPNSELCALFESAVPNGDRLLLWGADNGSSRFYWPGASPFWFLWRRPDAPSLAYEPKPDLQPAVLFRGAGHAVLQSPNLWLAFSGGRTHNRRDLGAFVLVLGKERFVHIPASNKDTATSDQSTVLVNGQGQRRDVFGTYRRFGSGEGFRYLALDLSDTYADQTLKRFTRHLVFVDDAYIVILDDLESTAPAAFETRIQTEKNPRTTSPHAGLIPGETADLHVLAASPKGVVASTGQGVLRYLAFKPAETTSQTTLVTVLYPTAPGEAPPQARFQNGLLAIGADKLRFEEANGAWRLQTVNGADASQIPTGEARSIVPLR